MHIIFIALNIILGKKHANFEFAIFFPPFSTKFIRFQSQHAGSPQQAVPPGTQPQVRVRQ